VSLMRGVGLRSSAKAAGPRIANATTGITLLCFSFLWSKTRRCGSTLGCILSSTWRHPKVRQKEQAPASQIRSRWLIKSLFGVPRFLYTPCTVPQTLLINALRCGCKIPPDPGWQWRWLHLYQGSVHTWSNELFSKRKFRRLKPFRRGSRDHPACTWNICVIVLSRIP
jgi:hypothetical protein